jgi:polysaccharide biosynthesis/export protein VpsN
MFFRLLIALIGLLLSTVVLAQAAKPLAAPPANVVSNYKMAAGDVLTIRVFGEDDLSREKIRLTDAGTVFYPVLGEIQVLGKTVGELEKLITDGRALLSPLMITASSSSMGR